MPGLDVSDGLLKRNQGDAEAWSISEQAVAKEAANDHFHPWRIQALPFRASIAANVVLPLRALLFGPYKEVNLYKEGEVTGAGKSGEARSWTPRGWRALKMQTHKEVEAQGGRRWHGARCKAV